LPKVTWRLSVSEDGEENALVNQAILFGPKLSHLKFEIYVVSSSVSNALMALKGDGRWQSYWFIACYAKNTPTGISDQPILDFR
jgi:hypothetical protein